MKRAILFGTLLAGTLDIVEVIVFYALRGVAPMRVLQGVARGLIGKAATSGGWGTALLGLAIHFCIAFVVVTIYVLASRKWPALRSLALGALYGLVVFAVMTYVVLPFTASGPSFPKGVTLANLLFAHVFCVGIPCALAARRA